MKRVGLIVLLVAMLLGATTVGAEQPEDLHCPEGWLAKLEVDPLTWENPSGGSFGMSSDSGFLYSILNIWSGTHNLTGFCVKAGRGNTGILPMSALPYYTDDPAISHVVVYGERDYEPCSETVAGEKVFGEWEALSEPSFGDWVVDGNTRCRTGGQGFAQHWTQNFYDAQNPERVCHVDEGTNYRGQLLRECEEKECEVGMYLLHGYNYPCYLNQNPNHVNPVTLELEPDTPWQLPERYDGTVYMQDLCNLKYTCEGWTYDTFEWMNTWEFVCDWKPCLDCE